MIRAYDPILGPSRGDPVAFQKVFIGPDQKDADYVAGVAKWARVAGVDAAIVYVQFCQETTEPSITPLSPGTSVRWNRDRNPAGIGIPLDSSHQPVTINDGDEAARIHVQCLYSLVKRAAHPGVPIPPAWLPWFTSIWLPKAADAKAPMVELLADLNIRYVDSSGEPRATWAWDAAYLSGLLAYGAKWLSTVPDISGGSSMPSSAVRLPVAKAMLPAGFPTRSGVKLDLTRGPLHITIHETGNSAQGADAKQHATVWQHSQDAIDHQVSVHLYVGAKGVWQCLPLDEIGWHAGDGCNDPDTDIGCFRSIAIECEVNADSDPAARNRNLVICMSMLAAADPAFDWGSGGTRGKFDTEHYDQHIWVSQEDPPHDCPQQIRHDANPPMDWVWLMGQVDRYYPLVLEELHPAPVPIPKPMPTPDPNDPVPGIALPAGVTVDWLRQRWAGNASGVIVIRGKPSRWDPKGVISRTWLRKCLSTIPKGGTYLDGVWPAVKDFVPRLDGIRGDQATFENGWTLVSRPLTGGKGK